MELADFQRRRWTRARVFPLPRHSVLPPVGFFIAALTLLALGNLELLLGTEIRNGCVVLGLGLGLLGAYLLWHWKRVARTGVVEFRPEGFAYGRKGKNPEVLSWDEIYFVRLHQRDRQPYKLEIRLRNRSSHFIYLADESALRRLAQLVDPGPEALARIAGQVAAGRPLEEAAQESGLPDAESLL
jgi:hypothetical protein